MFKSRDGITLTTAHKVKGNEYDTVIAINLLNGKFLIGMKFLMFLIKELVQRENYYT